MIDTDSKLAHPQSFQALAKYTNNNMLTVDDDDDDNTEFPNYIVLYSAVCYCRPSMLNAISLGQKAFSSLPPNGRYLVCKSLDL